jgi:galactose mutarotase-like enzyme
MAFNFFEGFPYLGLWAAPGADFVCIEPWCGIADSVNANGDIEHKEGINKLPAADTFRSTWKVRFF